MSYARLGPDSDVYVFDHAAGGTECMWCGLIDGRNVRVPTHAKMVEHLCRHIDAGHKVPDSVIPALQATPDN